MIIKLLLKVTLSSLTIFSIVTAGQSQTKTSAQKKASAAIESMTKEEISKYYQRYHSRIPQKLPVLKNTCQKAQDLVNQNRLQKNMSTKPLPENMIFPGEFEEVKAILIAWPYMYFDSTGVNQARQLFKNLGLVGGDFPDSVYNYLDNLPDSIQSNDEKMTRIWDSLSNIYSSGDGNTLSKVISQPDVASESELATLFAQLAKAIDDNAEVWIRIMNAEDSIEIKKYLAGKNITLTRAKYLVYPGNDFWTRDYGPVAFYYGPQDSIGFIDFEYYNGRPLDDSISMYIGKEFGYPVFTTPLEYEGGNILLDGCRNLFTSDAIYVTNEDTTGQFVFDGLINGEYSYHQNTKKSMTKDQVHNELKTFLNLDKFLILPSLKYDGGTGHIDLYADLVDENSFVFSQMPSEMSSFTDFSIVQNNISDIMNIRKSDSSAYRKSSIPFPRKDDGSWYENNDDYNKYTRTYSNHVFVNKTIIQPVFANQDSGDYKSLQKDMDSLKLKYPGYKIIPIYSKFMDGMGGAIHCITKQIPADNPLRIMHLPIEPNTEYKTSYPINAKVYNKSGIAKTICKWRYKGTTSWNSIQLTAANSNNFSGAIENNQNSSTIEYYLEATSNNGKTITKPITAPDGFYSFSFATSGIANSNVECNKGNITIFQKPSMKKVYIRTPQFKNGLNVQLFNIAGKAVYSGDFSTTTTNGLIEINTASMNTGTFIVIIKSRDGYAFKEKLMITK